MDWFTADTHLGHHNIIRYCNRPFTDVTHMGNVIISNTNEVVRPNDRLYHIGDVANKEQFLAEYKERLICKNVFVIPGNHDREQTLRKYFSVLPQCYMYTEFGNKEFRIVLCHYAMRVWEHSHHGAGMLYGHSHGGLPPVPGAPSFDVGVDSWQYHPLSIIDVKREMKRLCALKSESTEHNHHGNIPAIPKS